MALITQLLSKEFFLLCQGMGASHLCPVGFDTYLVVPKLEFFPPFSRFFSTSCIRELGCSSHWCLSWKGPPINYSMGSELDETWGWLPGGCPCPPLMTSSSHSSQ